MYAVLLQLHKTLKQDYFVVRITFTQIVLSTAVSNKMTKVINRTKQNDILKGTNQIDHAEKTK